MSDVVKITVDQAIVGCLIVYSHEVMPELISCGITSDLFKDGNHKALFDIIMEYKDFMDEYPDEVILYEKAILKKNSFGADFFTEWNLITEIIYTPDKLKYWINEFIRQAKRKLDAQGYKLHGLITAEMQEDEVLDALARAKVHFERSNDLTVDRGIKMDEMLLNVQTQIKNRIEGNAPAPDFDMSFLKDFSEEFNGFFAPQLVVIAARPGCGKTSLLTQAIKHNAKNSEFGILYTLEMGGEEIIGRQVCQEGYVNTKKVEFVEEMQVRYQQAFDDLSPVIKDYIDIQDLIFNIEQIEAHCERISAIKKIKWIGIDYIQLITSIDPSLRGSDLITEITRRLKLMAKKFSCPVIALSQLNRGSESENRPPRMSDLRQSGSIEQDADIVILLHHDKKDERSNPSEIKVEMIIPKWRNGPTGSCDILFRKSTTNFGNYKPEEPEQTYTQGEL